MLAWMSGIAFRCGYVAAKSAEYKYPALDEMFPTGKSEERDKTPEEQEFEWRAHRAELMQMIGRRA